MNNNSIRMKTACILCACVLLFVMSLISCNNEAPEIPEPETDGFTHATDEVGDVELGKRYAEYLENSSLAFKSISPTSPESFNYDVSCEGVTIQKYIGSDAIVVIPDTIEGITVNFIEAGAFDGTNIRALYIPDSVDHIVEGTLTGCSSLATLRLPFIGDGGERAYLGYLFGAKSSDENAVKVPPTLDMVIVGGDVTEIEDEAFLGCKSLSAVVLPDSVKSIGNMAFYECADLCFISLGSGVESIGEYAFAYCSSLYYVDCSTATDVKTGAFLYCPKLNGMKLKLSDGEFLGKRFGADIADHNGEFVPDSLRKIEVAEGCTSIPDKAFSECRYITSVTLPATLESIGVRAFYLCRSLKSIDIPDSTEKIDDDAFWGCDSLESAMIGNSVSSLGMQSFFGCKSLKTVVLPTSLKEIKPSTFYGCASLNSVELGGVKKIGKNAFAGCNALSPFKADGIEIAEGNDSILGEDE